MSGTSKTTSLITIRLPNEVLEIARRRVAKQVALPQTVSEYLRNILVLQLTREHGHRSRKGERNV